MKPLPAVYAVVCYLISLAAMAYAVGFVGNLLVVPSIDVGAHAPLTEAVVRDLALLALFGVQHSLMARPGFKAWWTRIVPRPVERSTYILISSLTLALLFWQWRPIPQLVWEIEAPVGSATLQGLFWLGWATVVASTYLISHFELFGLSQVGLGPRPSPAGTPAFRTPLLYKLVRHPLYLGFLIAFWATPRMTAGHLLFAAVNTAYVLIAIQFEERDLIAAFGDAYRDYRKRVSMILPLPPRAP